MNYQTSSPSNPASAVDGCVRGMRITVGDVLGWLAAGMSHDEIRTDYPELTEDDIRACLAYAADRERRLLTAASRGAVTLV